ncbi:hypothetical protein [Spirosoma rhododendri]|uniref:Outer membrane protein beta-barrel domain-containing protein n=1 Tax=Spirosoma rhododendri TaxID=2728024 RepID=A0A7L5DGQ9_9BACT|nr:hypothetical protein [Spirosoma rhododendri]QJD77389.1 hypothetical protein HH216_02360 [Spirosoma rhododendri]
MRLFLLTLTAILLSTLSTYAQYYRNTGRVGVDFMSLDAPDDTGFRYWVRYDRHLAQDRIVLSGTLGYANVANRRQYTLSTPVIFDGRPRQRVTADLTLSYDFIRSYRHALRLGGGLSVWYRQDDVVRQISLVPGNAPAIDHVEINETNVGYHLTAEYEYALTTRVVAAGRFGLANLGEAGISSLVGISLGRRF